MAEWQQLKVLNFEMESSALLTICATFGLKAACISAVIANRLISEKAQSNTYDDSMKKIIQILKKAI